MHLPLVELGGMTPMQVLVEVDGELRLRAHLEALVAGAGGVRQPDLFDPAAPC